MKLDEEIAVAERRSNHATKIVEDREAELTTARLKLVKAEGAAHDGQVADIAGNIIKTTQGIHRDLSGLIRGLRKRLDLADELIVARNGAPMRPSLRQVRGLPHLPAVITARLSEVFPRDFSRPHSALARLHLVEHERRLFAPLINGEADHTPDTPPPAEAPAEEE